MDKIARMKMKNLSNEDIFAIFTVYVKDSISQDIRSIYNEEAELLDSEEPWMFRIKGKPPITSQLD